MKSVPAILSAGLFCALAGLLLQGCETGRANKLHAGFESVKDVTTFPHPNPQYASIVTGNPPVPGSPTSAGPDGLQPVNDNTARSSPGAEKGIPMWPERQPKDSFLRQ